MILDQVWATLEALGAYSTPLGLATIALFLVGAALEHYGNGYARATVTAGWVLFGAFWFTLIHHFVFVQLSVVEGLGAILAVPLSLYLAALLWRGRDSLFVLSRAVAVMGITYFAVLSVPAVETFLIEVVTRHTGLAMNLIGYDPNVLTATQVTLPDGSTLDIAAKDKRIRNTFVFDTTGVPHMDDPLLTYTIITACTGIGSMAIFIGLILAVRAPYERKLRALAVSIPVIYLLNIVRNVFIGITFGNQMTHFFPDVVMSLFGLEYAWKVSYIISDRILAQGLAVVALMVITWLVVRELPEVLTVIEDVLYVVTRQEYDLQDALGFTPPDNDVALD